METCAVNFHITPKLASSLKKFGSMTFDAGSDATAAFWIDYIPSMKLYASHGRLMAKAVELLLANDDYD